MLAKGQLSTKNSRSFYRNSRSADVGQPRVLVAVKRLHGLSSSETRLLTWLLHSELGHSLRESQCERTESIPTNTSTVISRVDFGSEGAMGF
jgi:hypothetical protein